MEMAEVFFSVIISVRKSLCPSFSFSASTSISTSISITSFQQFNSSAESKEKVENTPQTKPVVDAVKDSVEVQKPRQSSGANAEPNRDDRLLDAAKTYLDTLKTVDQIFGFNENDQISHFARSIVNAGSGDDLINTSGRSRINAGSGDDIINASRSEQDQCRVWR